MPPDVMFGTQLCGNLEAGAEREWLVTDGLGGYAMGTVSGLRTRRYHGLLMVAGAQPASRHLGLAALDPVIRLGSGSVVRLATNEWAGGTLAPEGHRYLDSFELRDGLPLWRWRIGDLLFERELAMVHGRSAVGVVFRLVSAPGPVEVSIEALGTWRDAHGERRADGGGLPMTEAAGGVILADAYRITGPGWQTGGEWWFNAYAREEAARGLNAVEDLWLAGRFTKTLTPGQTLEIEAWSGDLSTPPPAASQIVADARARAADLIETARAEDPVTRTLTLAADAFIVAGGQFPDVVAGYPWFGVWSRDTMTSYEGLFLDTYRSDEGRRLLLGYAATVRDGLLANTADTGSTEYNTADATMWYLHAIGRHVERTGDDELASAVMGTIDEILRAHIAGTRYDIKVDPADGLLSQGVPGEALTWMDARINGIGVTPRIGKAVEINALWINGLGVVGQLRSRLGLDVTEVRSLYRKARASFEQRFPSPKGWLYDVVDSPNGDHSSGDDAALRPNQLLAYSLPYAPLRGRRPDPAVGAALMTPLGPRSLAPDDPAYRGAHVGSSYDRDMAYHQGTVWPWLIGPFADATSDPGQGRSAILTGLVAHLGEWGVGSVSETASGDAPHRATGCPFQAWSVAEMLRIHRSVY